MEELKYKSSYEDEPIKMELQVSQYLNSGAIYLGLICETDGFPEPYGDITVNLGTVPDYCGFLDVNNMEGIKEFVEEHGLGRSLEIEKASGFCRYPLYEFDKEKLRELCPEGMKQYELAIARSVAEAKRMPLNETKGR